MAEGFLSHRSRRLFGREIEVASAGTWAHSGSPPMFDAVRAAAQRGIDIGGLRSAPFSRREARRADLVLAMTAEQREEILAEAPDAGEKTFTLKEVVALLEALPPPTDAGPSRQALVDRIEAAHELREAGRAPTVADEDVADPLGLPEDAFGAVAREIDLLIHRLAEGLVGTPDRASVREG
jgi:protein-tyrosine phosphatase